MKTAFLASLLGVNQQTVISHQFCFLVFFYSQWPFASNENIQMSVLGTNFDHPTFSVLLLEQKDGAFNGWGQSELSMVLRVNEAL